MPGAARLRGQRYRGQPDRVRLVFRREAAAAGVGGPGGDDMQIDPAAAPELDGGPDAGASPDHEEAPDQPEVDAPAADPLADLESSTSAEADPTPPPETVEEPPQLKDDEGGRMDDEPGGEGPPPRWPLAPSPEEGPRAD